MGILKIISGINTAKRAVTHKMGDKMKALTILQPYAGLIRTGAKTYETRGWDTKYRGKLLIHAGKNTIPFTQIQSEAISPISAVLNRDKNAFALCGAFVAIADIAEVWQIIRGDNEAHLITRTRGNEPMKHRVITGDELLFGDYRDGRYAWELQNVRPIPTTIYCRGNQRLWEAPESVVKEILEALENQGE